MSSYLALYRCCLMKAAYVQRSTVFINDIWVVPGLDSPVYVHLSWQTIKSKAALHVFTCHIVLELFYCRIKIRLMAVSRD